ncbi:MAG: hypothetical protein HY835_01820 [Anaerolineae bacterium]|nr:hypothetical protein [Anaerolineae bacterium]
MLDDLRNEANTSYEKKETPPFEGDLSELESFAPRRQRRSQFLGMTPGQRFAIMLLLFMMACVLGAFCLIVFDKVVLPI